MKTKFLLFLIFSVVFTLNISAQRITVFSDNSPLTASDPSDDNAIGDCFTDGFATIDFFQVSGVPSDFSLQSLRCYWSKKAGPLELVIALTSPAGTRVTIMDSQLGSWPSMSDPIVYDVTANKCTDLLHTDPFECPASPSALQRVGTVDPLTIFDGEDLNGTWIIEICGGGGGGMIEYDELGLRFDPVNPWSVVTDMTNAANCTSNDGSVSFFVANGTNCSLLGNNAEKVYSIDGEPYVVVPAGSGDPCLANGLATIMIGNLSAGLHTITTAAQDGSGNIISGSEYIREIQIDADDPSGAAFDLICPPDAIVPFDSSSPQVVVLDPPAFDLACYASPIITTLRITRPDGTEEVIDPYDPTQAYLLPIDQEGDFEINYTAFAFGQGVAVNSSCSYLISSDPNAIVSFASPLCDDPSNSQTVTQCITVNDSQFIPIEISGLPTALSPEFGLRGVFVDATFSASYGSTEPFVDIVDPTGVRHRLFNPASFPQYDFNTQDFQVGLSACNSAGLPSSGDDIPFVPGATYKPLLDLNAVNLSGIDPNGTWQLQVCSGPPTWDLNCFSLDFGGTCASIEESDLVFGGTCVPTISVSYGDIDVPFCDDQDGDGLPDYYLVIDQGSVIQWDPANGLLAETTAGIHDVEFGTFYFDANNNAQFSCRQFFTVDVPPVANPDTEAPMLADCPTDQTIQLDANGEAVFMVTDPTAMDNCDIGSFEVTISFLDGTIDIVGGTGNAGTFDIDPAAPSTVTYPVQGAGRVVFEYTVTDLAGNTSSCTATYTITAADPCVNDTEDPVLVDCPVDQTAQFAGTVVVPLMYPSYTDNCAVTVADYFYDFTDVNGQLTIQQGPFTFLNNPNPTLDVTISEPGVAQVTWIVQDAAGNSSTCTTILTQTEPDPCANDTEAPVLTNCPDDITITLDASGQQSFDLIYPDASDNCAVDDGVVIFTYLDGATDLSGQTFATFGFVSGGGPFSFVVVGAGRVEIEYRVGDAAGNFASCTSMVTANADPCANETEAPMLADCPTDQTIQLDANGEAVFMVTDPTATDNCDIASMEVTISFLDGTIDIVGGTGNAGTFDIDPAAPSTVTYPVQGTGRVVFEYVVTDASGNSATCMATYTIEAPDPCVNDTEDPTLADCPTDQTIQLDANGEAVFMVTDPTATDNCDIASMEVTISFLDGTIDIVGGTGNAGTFDIDPAAPSTVTYPVQGAGRVVFEYVVTDASGNSATCMATYTIAAPDPCVNDTEAPVIIDCPADQTVTLDSNLEGQANYPNPNATDNCGVDRIQLDLVYSGGATRPDGSTTLTVPSITIGGNSSPLIDGAGTVTATYTAYDAAGNVSSACTVVITSVAADPCVNDTEAPVFSNCPASETLILEADDTQTFSIVDPGFTDNCPDIASAVVTATLTGGMTFESGTTGFSDNIQPGTPFTYNVVGAGVATFDFVVTDAAGNTAECTVTYTLLAPTGACENDTEAPVLLDCPGPQVVEIVDGEGQASFTSPNATDNCAIDRLQVDLVYSGGAVGPNGNTFRTFPSVTPGGMVRPIIVGTGTLTLTYTAFDPSGNVSDACVIVVNAVLPGDDVLFTIGEACAVSGVNTTLPVTVTNFEAIQSFSFDLIVPDGSGLSFVGIENQNLSGLAVNVLGNGNLRVGWNDPAGNAVTLDDNRRIFDIVITADNTFAAPSTVTGIDLDIFSDVNENGSINIAEVCIGQSVTPLGDIVSPLGRPHADVLVNLVAGPVVVGQTTTDAAGSYDFGTSEVTARVFPVKTDGLRDGITIADVARIRRHFLQTRILDTDYQRVAADVNKDGKINFRDVAINNQILLFKRSAFPNNTPWRFIPASLDISENPLDVNIASDIRLDAASTDVENLDFISVKTGDVDHSSLLDGRKASDNRTAQTIALIVPDTIVSPMEEVRLPVAITGGESVSLFSMTMTYDTTHVRLVGIESALLPGFGGGNFTDLGGEVIIAWDHPMGNAVTGDGTLMTFVFESVAMTGKADIVISELNFQNIDFEEFTVTGTGGSIDFTPTSTGDIGGALSITASPNPFADQALLEISTQTAQNVTVRISDISGRLLQTITTDRPTREHAIVIDQIDAKGVLLLHVEGEDFIEVLRLIKI